MHRLHSYPPLCSINTDKCEPFSLSLHTWLSINEWVAKICINKCVNKTVEHPYIAKPVFLVNQENPDINGEEVE